MNEALGATAFNGPSPPASQECAEVAAQLAVLGAVASIAGTITGHIGIRPLLLSSAERREADIPQEGQALRFELRDGCLFLHSDGINTTIWFSGPGCARGADVLEALLLSSYPAVHVRDAQHASSPNLKLRTFEVRLPNDRLAVVDAVYPRCADELRFMIRVTAMARQN